MKSKTKIQKQLLKKRNPELVETIIAAKKNDKWLEVAHVLSDSTRKRINKNIQDLEKEGKGGTIVVPGKVLSVGECSKKIKVVALSFSEKAREKLLKSKCEVSNILDEIKSNPNAKGIQIIK